jgi:hypothetical protein
MKRNTGTGHKYKLGHTEFITVYPSKTHPYIGNSSVLQRIMDNPEEALVVNLRTGELTVHRYPEIKTLDKRELEVWYFTESVGVRHKIFTSSVDAAIRGTQFIWEHYGRGTVVCFELDISFIYDGNDDELLNNELGFIFLRHEAEGS